MNKKIKKRGIFTLIELLLTIAIIVMLAGLLFPALIKAKERSKNIMCLNNLKQTGTRLQIYSNDYEMTLPPGYTYSTGKIWKTLLQEAVGNVSRDLLYCPIKYNTSYGMNAWCTNYKYKITKMPPHMMLVADSVFYGIGGYPTPIYGGADYIIQGPYEHSGLGTVDRMRHTNGANSVFVDSHAEWLKWNNIPIVNMNTKYWSY